MTASPNPIFDPSDAEVSAPPAASTPPTRELIARGLTLQYGDRVVLDGIDLTVPRGARRGVIGENGSGKSTLLRVLAGLTHPDEGDISRPARTGYLPQEEVLLGEGTVGDLRARALRPATEREQELERAATALSSGGAQASATYDRLLAHAERDDIWSAPTRWQRATEAFGMDRIATDRPLRSLSGGQRRRLFLAELLVSAPDALILDEPSNDLDTNASLFLSEQLRAWRGPVLFSSHDRAFIDDTATGLYDLDGEDPMAPGGVVSFTGSVSDYRAERARSRARWEQRYAEEGDERRRLAKEVTGTAEPLRVVTGMRDNNKMAYGMRGDKVQAQISRRVANVRRRLQTLDSTRVAEPRPELHIAPLRARTEPDTCAVEGELVSLHGAAVAGRVPPVDLVIEAGSRWLLSGPNGSGKSTVLGLIAGTVQSDTGSVRRAERLRIGHLRQELPDAADTRTARELYAATVGSELAERRPLEESGLLAPGRVDQGLHTLSAGMRRRVMLAAVLADPPPLLLLDEPSNHLSILLVEELRQALDNFAGAVVVASHDRWWRAGWSGGQHHLPGSVDAMAGLEPA